MIYTNKSVAIFTHPRSGSSWFQHSLTQYSLSELFNLNVQVDDYDEYGIKFKFDILGYDIGDRDVELNRRFEIYNYFESIKKNVSVKIHTAVLNAKIIDFLKNKNIQVVTLERNHKRDVFWSFIISWNLNQWHDSISACEITITKKSFDRVLSVMESHTNALKIVNKNFITTNIVYEELLSMPNNQWFNSTSKYTITDYKTKATILNLNEVNMWLVMMGHEEWVMV